MASIESRSLLAVEEASLQAEVAYQFEKEEEGHQGGVELEPIQEDRQRIVCEAETTAIDSSGDLQRAS